MAQIWEFIKIALMNIKSNKGRSVLTMLGIIIGISSVIMIISIGNGVKSEINGELNDMAGGQLYLSVDNNNADAKYIEFTMEDFEALQEKVPHIKGVTPAYGMYGTATGRKGSFDATLMGGTPGLEFQTREPVIKGKYFTDTDYYAGNKVCIISESSAVHLFGTTDVVGMDMEITLYGISQDLTIIGIRQDSESSMLTLGTNVRIQVEMPVTVLGTSFGFYVEGFEGFYIIAEATEYATEVARASVSLMESRYDVRGEGRMYMENFNDYMGQINSVLGYITIFVVFVAAISLLVGGIGVMNIMLVSVTERTREIGIRKSLGARTYSIMLQFLSESAIITLLGGLIGIVLGVAGAFGICTLIGFTPEVRLSTIIGASVFSSAVGIFFGIYPAKKAADLSPIVALRHE